MPILLPDAISLIGSLFYRLFTLFSTTVECLSSYLFVPTAITKASAPLRAAGILEWLRSSIKLLAYAAFPYTG